jgi:glycosyltransferase involved in cell wall biosynthesis
MKILLTADPELPVPPRGYGGIERIVDALVRYFQSEGHFVGLVAHPDSTCPADSKFSWPAVASGGRMNVLRNALALRGAVRAFRPDVLHSFSRLGYLLPLLRSRLPKIMSYQRHTGGAQLKWATRLAGNTLQFTGCSEFICRMGRPAGGAWHAVPNFVELDKIHYASEVPADAPLLFLSRVETIKGPDLAIAIARASHRRLIIAGNRADSGSEREFWDRAIAPELGSNGIEYVGEVGDAQKNALLGRAAALVVPVQWDEPFGIVFAEALAAGTPVISCARGALPEIVEPGRTGFLINTIAEGAMAVARIPTLARHDCRSAAENRFSVQVCGAKYMSLYPKIATSGAPELAARQSSGVRP